MDEPFFVMIPRRSGKRLSVVQKAIQAAKEGNTVMICDIGGQNKVLEPIEGGNVLIRKAERMVKPE